jgi:hypothetical protein
MLTLITLRQTMFYGDCNLPFDCMAALLAISSKSEAYAPHNPMVMWQEEKMSFNGANLVYQFWNVTLLLWELSNLPTNFFLLHPRAFQRHHGTSHKSTRHRAALQTTVIQATLLLFIHVRKRGPCYTNFPGMPSIILINWYCASVDRSLNVGGCSWLGRNWTSEHKSKHNLVYLFTKM